MSVYSLYTNLTTQGQGCLTAQDVDWSSVTTLHDFEGLTLQDCQERCDTMEGPGFSISRLTLTDRKVLLNFCSGTLETSCNAVVDRWNQYRWMQYLISQFALS